MELNGSNPTQQIEEPFPPLGDHGERVGEVIATRRPWSLDPIAPAIVTPPTPGNRRANGGGSLHVAARWARACTPEHAAPPTRVIEHANTRPCDPVKMHGSMQLDFPIRRPFSRGRRRPALTALQYLHSDTRGISQREGDHLSLRSDLLLARSNQAALLRPTSPEPIHPGLPTPAVAFGKVLEGMEVVERISRLPVAEGTHQPSQPVTISECGEVVGGESQGFFEWLWRAGRST
jgi:hypothetical protein